MNILKVYKYRGAKIFIIQVSKIMQYFIVWRDNLYANYFNLEKKSKNEKELGSMVLLVSNAAEGVVDSLLLKHSFWYKIIGKKPKAETKQEQKLKVENVVQ